MGFHFPNVNNQKKIGKINSTLYNSTYIPELTSKPANNGNDYLYNYI